MTRFSNFSNLRSSGICIEFLGDNIKSGHSTPEDIEGFSHILDTQKGAKGVRVSQTLALDHS